MKAYKCDRCGELYEPTLNSPKFQVKKYRSEWQYEDVDLCKSCSDDLERFLTEADDGTKID